MALVACKKLNVRAVVNGAMSLVFAFSTLMSSAPALGKSSGASASESDDELFQDYWASGNKSKFRKTKKHRSHAKHGRRPASEEADEDSEEGSSEPKPAVPVKLGEMKPRIRRFSIKGEEFRLIEYKNKYKKIIRQILMGKDFVQIANGARGIESLDSWEYETGDLRISMSGPLNGAFQMMSAVKRTRGASIEMKFARTRAGDYRLYSAKPMKMKFASTDGYDDFVVGCAAADQDLQKLAAELNTVLSAQGDNYYSDIVKKNILKNCDASPFGADVSNQIAAAVNKVAKSDLGWTESSVAGNTIPATKGTFLQCLRYFDLATHASRISASLAQWDPKVVTTNPHPWTIKCDASTSNLGEAQMSTALKDGYVILGSPANQKKKYPNDDLSTSYSKTFFHEMLHVSGIDDENLTAAIESCCGQAAETSSCSTVREAAANQKRKQAFESELIKNMGGENYADLMASADYNLKDGSKLIDGYLGSTSSTYNQLAAYPRCQGSNGHLTDACNQEYQEAVKSISETYFGNAGMCVIDAKAAGQNDADAKEYCTALRQAMEEKITGINSTALDDFCTAHKAKTGASLDGLKPWQVVLGLFNPPVSAVTTDRYEILCKIEAAKNIDPNPAGYTSANSTSGGVATDPGAVRPPSTSSTIEQKQNAETTGSTSTVSTRDSSSSSYRDTSAGPSGRNYSNDHQQRADQILSDIRRQREVGSRVNTTTAAVLKSLLPEASATEGKQGSSSGSGSSFGKITVPDPSGMMPNGSSSFASAMQASSIAANGAATVAANAAASGENGRSPATTAAAAAAAKARAQLQADGNVAGMSGAAAAKMPIDPKKTLANKIAEDKALRALLVFLQQPYDKVKPELDRKGITDSMVHYNVQAIDMLGRVHGSGFPKYKLVYSERLNRLVLAKEKTDR